MSQDIEAAMAAMNDEPLPNPNAEPAPEPSKVEQPRNDNGQFVSPDQDEPAEARDSDEPAFDGEGLEPEASADEGDSTDDEQQQDRPKKRSLQERLGQVTAQKHEAIARAQAAEQRLQELQERLSREIDPELEWEDNTKWNTQQFERVLDQREAQQTQAELQRAAQAAYQANLQAFESAAEEARNRIPDFDQVVYRPDVPITQAAVEYFGDSPEHAAEIAYYLGKNPQVAQRIASQTPQKQWAELARIEARFQSRPQKRTTAAPPPARAVTGGGGSSGQISPQDASVEDIGKLLGYGRKS